MRRVRLGKVYCADCGRDVAGISVSQPRRCTPAWAENGLWRVSTIRKLLRHPLQQLRWLFGTDDVLPWSLEDAERGRYEALDYAIDIALSVCLAIMVTIAITVLRW